MRGGKELVENSVVDMHLMGEYVGGELAHLVSEVRTGLE
jgi:hypothetical protein